MAQSNDSSDEKSLKKDQMEHAKMIYERNKEIYKYTFESMKFLDSKLTRAMTLITFMFTVQAGFMTLAMSRLQAGCGKILLTIIVSATFVLLMRSLITAVDLSKPKERLALTTNKNDSDKETQEYAQTLQLYVNISHSLASAHESLEGRNKKQAKNLISIHKNLVFIYSLVCISALLVCFFSPNPS